MKKAVLSATFVATVGIGFLAVAQTAQQPAPKVKFGSQLIAKVPALAPGPNAKNAAQKSSIGTATTTIKAWQPSSFWTEEQDVDDDGTVETFVYLYDVQRGILYTYREDNFSRPNGNPETGSILMALYDKGNRANLPVGSGWNMVSVDGNATECGAATVNKATGDIELVVSK